MPERRDEVGIPEDPGAYGGFREGGGRPPAPAPQAAGPARAITPTRCSSVTANGETVAALEARVAPRAVLSTAERNEKAQRLFDRAGFRRTMIEMTRERDSEGP